jgi:hypothetical protein
VDEAEKEGEETVELSKYAIASAERRRIERDRYQKLVQQPGVAERDCTASPHSAHM